MWPATSFTSNPLQLTAAVKTKGTILEALGKKCCWDRRQEMFSFEVFTKRNIVFFGPLNSPAKFKKGKKQAGVSQNTSSNPKPTLPTEILPNDSRQEVHRAKTGLHHVFFLSWVCFLGAFGKGVGMPTKKQQNQICFGFRWNANPKIEG